MDYALAIRRNRDQLKDIVLALFTLARMRVGGSLFTLPRSTFAMIMLVLRPAESAVRRLIVIAAQGLALNSLAKSAAALPSPRLRGEVPSGAGRRGAYRAFPLFDPLKSFDPEAIWDSEQIQWHSGYDITATHGYSSSFASEEPLDATHLGHRLNALIRALNDIPRQARRLKRWELKRDAALQSLMLRCEQREPRSTHPTWHPRRLSPMRPGLPPGWRERKVHEIDDVLRECHGLANDRLNAPNTS